MYTGSAGLIPVKRGSVASAVPFTLEAFSASVSNFVALRCKILFFNNQLFVLSVRSFFATLYRFVFKLMQTYGFINTAVRIFFINYSIACALTFKVISIICSSVLSIILFNRFLNMLKESFGKRYFPGRLSMIKNTLPVTEGAVEIGSA